ncbi:hypothetical protein L198_04248 [Cryptococcus wingfieldii CBS 7118]|uniref:Protein CPL1-like domain-containing protein n=1 Tax=Cryptococcus wingfieldii CBS 7118 TaxID=1295528 RepID=A0A1E3J6N6_9TREE|nr:hypothetical protein L198_04248 [Cryptococcus wingfieldii CBS 7118]ODN96533.1 hypothetical protein L198_04248 [Cryptococcus wingfieldii CBS 7118]
MQAQCSGSTYALFIAKAASFPTTNCYCTSSDISAINYLSFSTTATTCAPIAQAAVYRTDTTFTYQGCAAGAALNILGATATAVSAPAQCLSLCASYRNAFFSPLGVTYQCVCGDPTLSISFVACTSGLYYVYTHPADAAASGLARRKRHLEVEERMKRSQMIRERGWDCPKGMQACNVKGAADTWECIDPKSDLETCGGCAYGDYIKGLNNTPSSGMDCSTLPGVYRGSVTCSDGRCVAYACKRGWTLEGGICMKSLTVQP